jgi:hypothetical protein
MEVKIVDEDMKASEKEREGGENEEEEVEGAIVYL